MKDEVMSIIAIILGIIIIAFPLLGFIGVSAIVGLSLLLMSIFLLVLSISEIEYNNMRSIINLILGFVILIISISILFNPSLLAFLTGITLYLAGIFLIIIGVVTLIGNRDNQYAFYQGIMGIILGLIYIIVSTYISSPIILGSIIGIWLIATGVLSFLE